jgi:hypothetical protein
VSDIGHGIQRIGDNDQDGIWRILYNILRNLFDNLGVDGEQIIAAHSGLAGNPCGDNNDVGISRILVIVGADDIGIKTLDGSGLAQVESFALRHAFNDINDADIPQLLGCSPVGRGGAYETSANDSDLVLFQSHGCSSFEFVHSRFNKFSLASIIR